jgi:nicotinamidase-related amidase
MKPAVIVIDMLKDAVKPFTLEIVPAINRLTSQARERSIPVVFSNDSFLRGDFIFRGKMHEHSIRGTSGAEVMDQLEQTDTDIYVPKRRFSAFFKTDLDQTLHLYQVDTVAIAGINTHWCILNTVFDALALDFNTYIISDGCTSFSHEVHETTLNLYRDTPLYPMFQVMTADSFIAMYDN